MQKTALKVAKGDATTNTELAYNSRKHVIERENLEGTRTTRMQTPTRKRKYLSCKILGRSLSFSTP